MGLSGVHVNYKEQGTGNQGTGNNREQGNVIQVQWYIRLGTFQFDSLLKSIVSTFQFKSVARWRKIKG